MRSHYGRSILATFEHVRRSTIMLIFGSERAAPGLSRDVSVTASQRILDRVQPSGYATETGLGFALESATSRN